MVSSKVPAASVAAPGSRTKTARGRYCSVVGGSQNNPLELVERDLVVATVVELGCARAFMRRHLLSVFEQPAVEQVTVILIARKVWQPSRVMMPAVSARRTIIRRAAWRLVR
jgi:hypothetical protein